MTINIFALKGELNGKNLTGAFLLSGIYLSVRTQQKHKYIYHSMRYLFGIYKELIKCGLQRNSDKIVLYRSIYGISSELDITRIYMNTVK